MQETELQKANELRARINGLKTLKELMRSSQADKLLDCGTDITIFGFKNKQTFNGINYQFLHSTVTEQDLAYIFDKIDLKIAELKAEFARL